MDWSSVKSLTISWTLADGVIFTEYIITYSNIDCLNDIYDDYGVPFVSKFTFRETCKNRSMFRNQSMFSAESQKSIE